MKTADLIGPALDWAVAKCEGEKYQAETVWNDIGFEYPPHRYSTDWAQGGPIIELETYCLQHIQMFDQEWVASGSGNSEYGPTPLIAAMRCYVASKLGNEVEIPEDLK